METFSALLALCEGNLLVTGEFPLGLQRPVTQSFDVFFDLRLNTRLSKQSWGWWFETPPHSLWRHCYGWCSYRKLTLRCFYMSVMASQITDNSTVYWNVLFRLNSKKHKLRICDGNPPVTCGRQVTSHSLIWMNLLIDAINLIAIKPLI